MDWPIRVAQVDGKKNTLYMGDRMLLASTDKVKLHSDPMKTSYEDHTESNENENEHFALVIKNLAELDNLLDGVWNKKQTVMVTGNP